MVFNVSCSFSFPRIKRSSVFRRLDLSRETTFQKAPGQGIHFIRLSRRVMLWILQISGLVGHGGRGMSGSPASGGDGGCVVDTPDAS